MSSRLDYDLAELRRWQILLGSPQELTLDSEHGWTAATWIQLEPDNSLLSSVKRPIFGSVAGGSLHVSVYNATALALTCARRAGV